MAPDDARLLALANGAEVRAHLATPRTGVYIVRADGHIVWASPSMQAVTGRAPLELTGRNGWDVFVPPEDLAAVAEFRARLSEGDGTLWMRLRMPDDGRAWYRVDTMVREGGIVCAFRPEGDPAQQHLHHFMRPRPGKR
jgi:PAS domain S-box-containing protein